jgi:hypothetical protein
MFGKHQGNRISEISGTLVDISTYFIHSSCNVKKDQSQIREEKKKDNKVRPLVDSPEEKKEDMGKRQPSSRN